MFDLLNLIQHLVSSVHGWMTQTFHGSTMIAGAVTASIAGSVFYFLRKLPKHAWMQCKRYLFFTYEIEYRSMDKNSMISLIAEKFEYELQKRVAHKRAVARLVSRKKTLVESLSDGSFFFRHEGAIIHVSRYKENSANSISKDTSKNNPTIILSLTTLRFQKKQLLSILNQSTKEYMVPGVYQVTLSQWLGNPAAVRRVRNFTTLPVLAIDLELKKKIDDAIDNFTTHRETNNRLDISHKLVFMFYGEPGTGKSALGEYIAFRLKTSLFCTNGATNQASSMNISDIIDAARNNIVDGDVPVALFDDVDTIWPGIHRRGISKNTARKIGKYTATDVDEDNDLHDPVLLGRVLTGLQSPVEVNDCVIVFSTNHLENIDPAMYRPGRVTVLAEVGRMKPVSVMEYFEKVYRQKWPDHTPIEKSLRACDITAFYNASKDDPQGFINAVTSEENAADEVFKQTLIETIS